MKYWLLKSEPKTFSINDLKQNIPEPWDGIRNYQARNFMRDEMKPGDLAFFYHSRIKTPGITGLVKVCKSAYPDFTSWDPKSPYFDPKSQPNTPRWVMVDIKLITPFERLIPLSELKKQKPLEHMELLKKGSRLSIQPVTSLEFKWILYAMPYTGISKPPPLL